MFKKLALVLALSSSALVSQAHANGVNNMDLSLEPNTTTISTLPYSRLYSKPGNETICIVMDVHDVKPGQTYMFKGSENPYGQAKVLYIWRLHPAEGTPDKPWPILATFGHKPMVGSDGKVMMVHPEAASATEVVAVQPKAGGDLSYIGAYASDSDSD